MGALCQGSRPLECAERRHHSLGAIYSYLQARPN